MWKRIMQLSNGTPQTMPAAQNTSDSGSRMPAVLEPEASGVRTVTASASAIGRAPALVTEFEQIYQSGAVKPPRLAYGVLKVAEMLNSTHLAGLPADTKRAALMMALEAGNAKVEEILQDAIVRQRLLNDYEDARQRDMQNFEAAVLEQNRALQAEVERITAQYMSRMQTNLDEVARAQDNFRIWQKRKQQETQKIAEAAAYCVPETSAQAVVADGLKVVLERASSAGAR